MYVKNIASIVNGIKQHKDVVDTLAQYIKSIDIRWFKSEPQRVMIFHNGIWDYDEGRGTQGIAFDKLGMSNLDTVESEYALAIVLVDWLNNELKEEGKTYYAVDDYMGWQRHRICIRANAINSPKSNLKSWY